MSELPPINEALVERHRGINVDDDWWDCVYDLMISELADKGIHVDKTDMRFAGFRSQGDGASFTGRIEPAAFLKAHGLEAKFPAVMFRLAQCGLDDIKVRLVHLRAYHCHEGTVDLEIDWNGDVVVDEPVRQAIFEVWDRRLDGEAESFNETILGICRDHMRDLYKRLEAEHDYQTSDEQVWDTLVANDMHHPDEEEEDDLGA
jgi:hypothetical protein